MIYTIEARGDVREVYAVEAESENEARVLFHHGNVGKPLVSEADTEIVRVTAGEDLSALG